MQTTNTANLLPLVLFLALMLVISYWISKHDTGKGGFVKTYFIGGRSLGGFVLAMTTVATYSSLSSFIGGPGQAWSVGFGWIYMSVVQVTAIFLVLGVLGKKIAIISRKINAVTVIDIIRSRYESDLLATLSAVIIVIFFAATMVAQFVGGAKLFEAVTGQSYLTGLCLFGIIVIVYTAIGGFRGVAVTDTLCAIVMLVGMVLLAGGVLKAGGGYANIMDTLTHNHPEMLEPYSDGNMPLTLYITQWMLVGIFTFGLPQSVVRGMSYKNTQSLHRAVIIGTVVIGAMNIGMNLIGVLSRGILTQDLAAYGGNIDYIMPTAIVTTLGPVLAGITIVGPIAASISTVSSLLISSTSSIVKDIYMHHQEARGRTVADDTVRRMSHAGTLLIGAVIFVLSITPPDVIWKINMFAFGGLETAFCWVFLFGLFWRRANRTGALLSMAGGTLSYCVTMALGFKIMGLHQITIGITVSMLLMLAGSLFGKPHSREVLDLYFPEKST